MTQSTNQPEGVLLVPARGCQMCKGQTSDIQTDQTNSLYDVVIRRECVCHSCKYVQDLHSRRSHAQQAKHTRTEIDCNIRGARTERDKPVEVEDTCASTAGHPNTMIEGLMQAQHFHTWSNNMLCVLHGHLPQTRFHA